MTDAPESMPTPEQPTETAADTARTFTQDELDAIIQQRLARERAKFGDVEALQAKAARLDELEAAQMSELDKLQKRAAEAEAARDAAVQQARAVAMRSAVVQAAAAAGAIDAEAVLALLPEGSVTVADDGTVAGAAESVKALLKAKPWLAAAAAQPPVGSADGGPRGGAPAQLTRDDLARMTPEQIVSARAAGQLDNLLGK